MSIIITTEEYVKRAKKVHGNYYDYSQTIYKNSVTKVKIICFKHGEFYCLPFSHTQRGTQCHKCSCENRKYDRESFIEQAKKLRGDAFDYSEIEFVDINKKIKILCKKCNNFIYQKASNHLLGYGCIHCQKRCRTISKEDFIKSVKEFVFFKELYL